jgi:hypothetical protein
MTMRRLPLDPPWLIVLVLAGMLLGAASVWNEGWSIAVTYAGAILAGVPALLGLDRWLERNHPRPRR